MKSLPLNAKCSFLPLVLVPLLFLLPLPLYALAWHLGMNLMQTLGPLSLEGTVPS